MSQKGKRKTPDIAEDDGKISGNDALPGEDDSALLGEQPLPKRARPSSMANLQLPPVDDLIDKDSWVRDVVPGAVISDKKKAAVLHAVFAAVTRARNQQWREVLSAYLSPDLHPELWLRELENCETQIEKDLRLNKCIDACIQKKDWEELFS